MRYAAGVEYDGGAYSGWQSQKGVATVQSCVERALGRVSGQSDPLPVVCAGRTDAGVHALNQVIHFESDAERDEKAWVFGANANLPPDVRLTWTRPVCDEFHARFDAHSRDYRYVMKNGAHRPALLRNRCGWWPRQLDEHAMHGSAQVLLGEHDFSALRAAECQAHSPVRTITRLSCRRRGAWLVVDISANAFLHHMVRNIVGSLALIGQGDRPATWLDQVLASRDRGQAGPTAPAGGLYFLSPYYPTHSGVPEHDVNMLWSSAGLAPPLPFD